MKKINKDKRNLEAELVGKLLAYELFDRKIDTDIEEVDWSRVLDIGEKQSVLALMYPAVRKMNGVPDFVITKLRSAAMLSSVCVEELTEEENNILIIFKKENIRCSILKGRSVSCYYPHKELRLLGDIDILVDKNNIEKGKEVLEFLGYRCTNKNSIHHWNFCNDVFDVELHFAISRFPNNKKGRYCSNYLKNSLDKVEAIKDSKNRCIPILSVDYQCVALLKHMESHLMTKELRLRQLCDWAVFIEKNKLCIDDNLIYEIDQCGLLEFAKAITVVCINYLGLSKQHWCYSHYDENAEDMFVEIINSEMVKNENTNKYVRLFFTPRDDLKMGENSILMSYIAQCNHYARINYGWVNRCQFLLPIFWLYFPLKYFYNFILGKREKIDFKNLIEDITRRKRLINKLNLFK